MKMTNPYFMATGSFLLAWSVSNFEPDYRSVLSAVLCGIFGYLPKRDK